MAIKPILFLKGEFVKVNQKVIDLLEQVSSKLQCGWKVEHNKTAQSFLAVRECRLNDNRYFLFNQKGAYIEVTFSERGQSTLRIGFFSPRYLNSFNSVNSIQMNMAKGINSVASDINRRLISCLDEVNENLEKQTASKKKDNELAANRELSLNAIKMVSKCNWEQGASYNQYSLSQTVTVDSELYKECYGTDKHDTHRACIYQESYKTDSFNISLPNLTAEQVIKVITALNY